MGSRKTKEHVLYSLCFSGMGLCFAWKGLVSEWAGGGEDLLLRLGVPLVGALLWFVFTPVVKRRWALWTAAAVGALGTLLAWGSASLGSIALGWFDAGIACVTGANLLILLLWTDFYGVLKIRSMSIAISSAYVAGPLVYFAVRLLPEAFWPGLALVLPVASVACLLTGFYVALGIKASEGLPHTTTMRAHQKRMGFPWQPVVVVAAFAFAFGINRNYTTVEIDLVSQGVAGLVLMAIIVGVPRRFSVYSVYRFALPLMMAGLLVGAFFGGENVIAQVLINACYAFAAMTLIVILCDKAHRFGLSSFRLNGFARAITGAAFLCGGWAEQTARFVLGSSVNEVQAVYAATAIVIAAAALFWFSGRGYLKERAEEVSLEDREVASCLEVQKSDGNVESGGVGTDARAVRRVSDAIESKTYRELVMQRCEELSEEYRLSRREAEVLVLLARGWSAPRIEEDLVLSNSTVKTHIKHVYAKMGIHSRDELKMLLDIE